jgi:hypothetical protein
MVPPDMRRTLTLLVASLCGAAVVHGCSGGGGNQGAPVEAGADVKAADATHTEAATSGGNDGGGDAAGSTCPNPADISSWTPPAYVPAKNSPGACAPGDVAAYDAACVNTTTKSTSACDSFKSANATCVACLVSQQGDSSWGPIVQWPGIINLNLGGCLELAAGDATCAKAVETAAACPHAACDAVCPVTSGDATSFANWQQCEQVAVADACGLYEQAANCMVTDPAAISSVCQPTQSDTFDSLLLRIAPVFCGGGEAGAGEAGPAPEGGASEAGATDASEAATSDSASGG